MAENLHPMKFTLAALLALLLAACAHAADPPAEKPLPPEQAALAKKILSLLPDRHAKKDTAAGPPAGLAVFNKAGCAACHTVDGTPKIGPSLQGIARRGDVHYIIESILDPSRVIVEGYTPEMVETEDDSYIGFVKEAGDKLTITTSPEIVNTVEKKEVKSRRKLEQSLMPAGLDKILTPTELADLVAYLLTLKEGGPDPIKKAEASAGKK
jgi:putative heme-binding domain-containing protein